MTDRDTGPSEGVIASTSRALERAVEILAASFTRVRSPAAGRVFDNGETFASWEDVRENMPEVIGLDIEHEQRRIRAEVTAPEAKDPTWRLLVRCDSEPFISATIRARFSTREHAIEAGEFYMRALLFRPEVAR